MFSLNSFRNILIGSYIITIIRLFIGVAYESVSNIDINLCGV
jgi:hypothetical protein